MFQMFVHSSQVASIPEANSFRCFVSNKLLGGLGRRNRGDVTIADGSCNRFCHTLSRLTRILWGSQFKQSLYIKLESLGSFLVNVCEKFK